MQCAAKGVDAGQADFGVITLLADRAFPCAELLGWLEKQPGWT